MKATEAGLLPFLKSSPQFVIPIYQRTYSWTEKECEQLWDDILHAGQNDDVNAHFVGSVVYIQQDLYQVTNQSPLLVIDGQQRLTSVTLLLEAVARALGSEEPVPGFSTDKVRHYYLLNPLESGEQRYKLVLTQTDKDTLLALVQQKDLPAERSTLVEKNFEYFRKRVSKLGDNIDDLCRGLNKLMIVDVALTRNSDNPQLIFESMNSTGKELSQADLIRNYVLMGLEPGHQTSLYTDHWRPMERNFGQEAYGSHFDSFMRHYLTLKTGDIPKLKAVYDAFKVYAGPLIAQPGGVDALVSDVQRFAGHYCAMALDQEADPELSDAFADLRELRVDVAYPLMLELYEDYAAGYLDRSSFLRAVRLIDSYVFRRAICAIPTNSLNKTFSTFGRAIDKGRYIESIEARLLMQPSYRRFPTDDEFRREFSTRDLYNFPRKSYWLRRLENHGRKEKVLVDEYTIEHIMPQNENLSAAWQAALGDEWKRIHESKLHTLGNLTLTGYNNEYGDRPFEAKRDMTGGFAESPLRLNAGLGNVDAWNESQIGKRAERLAMAAANVWPRPELSAESLDTHRPQPSQVGAAYSIDNHQHLADGTPTREIFEAFRKEVLALDPCVGEESLKLYVAYKAETNFVDAVPQASGLRLSLNLPFHELHDPKGLTTDVTSKGRWGNGDVEVKLTDLDGLPYVVGLIRQSFERQMSGEGTS